MFNSSPAPTVNHTTRFNTATNQYEIQIDIKINSESKANPNGTTVCVKNLPEKTGPNIVTKEELEKLVNDNCFNVKSNSNPYKFDFQALEAFNEYDTLVDPFRSLSNKPLPSLTLTEVAKELSEAANHPFGLDVKPKLQKAIDSLNIIKQNYI